MFNRRVLIRLGVLYVLLFFLLSFWYLNKLERRASPSPRLAVLVPYRNRSSELDLFLPHMSSYLRGQSISHLFVIVNQLDGHRFNRAALINVGFLQSRSSVDYLVMHDIDLLPLNERELSYRYPKKGPVHLASPEYHPIYHYATYVGGILLISCEDFARVNGMSPLYWGWGREDDNFYLRMKRAGMSIYRPHGLSTNRTNTFRHIHEKNVHRRDTAQYGEQKEAGRRLRPETGWNTTRYKLSKNEIQRTEQGIEYLRLDVQLECDYQLTPWCDHPTASPIEEGVR